MTDTAAISAGREAWKRLQDRERTTWDDWLTVGRALVIGRVECMRIAGTDTPSGGKYNYVANQWLRENGFTDICAQERHRIVKIIENLPAVEAWRATLSPEDRRTLNHPSLWFKFCDATKRRSHPSPKPRPAGKTPGYQGKSTRPSQDTIRIIASALRQHWTNDTYVLAAALCEEMREHREIFLEFLNGGEAPKPRQRAETLAHAAA